jgi:hypothetical protein
MKKNMLSLGYVMCVLLLTAGGCGGDGSSNDSGGGTGGAPERPEDTGAACEVAADCYADVAEGDLQGEAMCLDRVRDGYCTHTCEADVDCCAAEGECKTDLAQVCAPFESTGIKMCFLTCEGSDWENGGYEDDAEYCQREASPDFICRSSGGGSQNRKVCVPGDCGLGARCLGDEDCSGGLECLTDFAGGYCSKRGCTSNADCPGNGSLCVDAGSDASYCAKACSKPSDCSWCRGEQLAATCRDDVTFVEEGTVGAVCVPD